MPAYSEIILYTHAYIPRGELKRPIDALRDVFTVRSKYEEGHIAAAYKETDKYFGAPLHYQDWSKLTNNLRDMRIEGEDVDYTFTSTLRPRQVPMFEEFKKAVHPGAQQKTGLIIDAPTGTGKTVVILACLAHYGKPTLVICPRNRIIDQWIERIKEHTSLTDDEIGIAQQDRCEYIGKKIVVGSIHSIAKDKYGKEFKKHFGAVVWDELHTAGAETLAKTLNMFPAKLRVGCSATLERPDGMEEIYNLHLGQKSIKMEGGTEESPRVFLRSYHSNNKHPYVNKVRDAVARKGILTSHLAKDLSRNALIVSYLKKFIQSDRRTLVMSDRIEQLEALHALLTNPNRGMLPSQKVGIFTGSTKKREVQRILDYCPVILATYGVMRMAIDVPDLRAFAFGTPLKDAEQAAGRILRKCEGASKPVILDIIDEDYQDCVRWAYTRQDLYRKLGAELYVMS